jgi:cardiolipin synthase
VTLPKPVRRAFKILFWAAVAVAIGLLLAQDDVVLRVRSAYAAEDERHPAYVATLLGADMRRGNSYDVLTNGDQLFPAMLDAIDGAKRRIAFETYIYDTGQVADRFTAAFEAAARRGVTVNIVVDGVGASSMDAGHVERLRKAGCKVAQFNSLTWYSLDKINFRTHRKILVVDEEVGFTGGAGIADHWLGNAQDSEHWRDTHFRIRGPIVRLLEGAFYENFIEASDDPIVPQVDELPPDAGVQAGSLIVRSSPSGGSNDLKRLYLLAVASAARTLDIQSPYFVTDRSTLWSLEEARRRGVRVRIIVEGDITDAMPVKYASRAIYDRLLSLGVEIYEYRPTMMHTKVLVVDGAWSIFGSANFDNRSLELNDELNVAVSDRGLAARLLEDFEADLRHSERLQLETWRQRSLLQKAREVFWAAFSEVF